MTQHLKIRKMASSANEQAGKLSLASKAILLIAIVQAYSCEIISTSATLQATKAATRSTTTSDRIVIQTDRLLQKRSHDKDFAPKLIHQPHSVSVQPNKPHTSECPVESQPESDVKWFKDNKLLENEPMHLEQTGSELMFFLVNDNDTGDYHCEATNYLGTVTSEQFRLTVQTSQLDENISLEPRTLVAAEHQDQAAEFTCTLPVAYVSKLATSVASARRRTASWPDLIGWRKNGKRLHQVVWTDFAPIAGAVAGHSTTATDHNDDAAQASPTTTTTTTTARYTARRGDRQNEFVLSVARLTRQRDDNSTFTCLYKPFELDHASEPTSEPEVLAHESRPALLRVESSSSSSHHQQRHQQPVPIDVHMAPPIDQQPVGGNQPTVLQNHTTQLHGEQGAGQPPTRRIRTSLGETLADLYEIIKPSMLVFGLVCLVVVLVTIQFLFLRRRAQANSNRYMKHHHHHQYSSSASTSSTHSGANNNAILGAAGSGAASALAGGDPVLSSLLSRTLAAPSASSLSVNAGKKYKLYRDHMRKVAAAAAITSDQQLVDSADFIDASTYFQQQQQHHQDQMLSSQLFTPAVPNLYNQCLAAREQARSLLQAGDHMRSLGNLANQQQQQQQQHFGAHQQPKSFAGNAQQNNNQLELPASFASFNGAAATTTGRASSSNSSSGSYGAQHEGPLETGASNLIGAANQMAFNQFLPGQFAASASRNQQLQQQQQQQQQQQLSDEHYQLVSCSSISPSSSSSIVAGGGGPLAGAILSSNKRDCDHQQNQTTTNREMNSLSMAAAATRESVSSNHYSTIGTNEDEEDEVDDRYEELDQQQQQLTCNANNRSFGRTSARSSGSSFTAQHAPGSAGQVNQARSNQQQQQQQQFQRSNSTFAASDANQAASARLRSSLISSGKLVDHSSAAHQEAPGQQPFNRNTGKLTSSRRQQQQQQQNGRSNSSSVIAAASDQLSPYAVSSISSHPRQVSGPHHQINPSAPQPPPVTSEALQALNEQFDINHLLKLDQQQQQQPQHSSGGANNAPPRLPFSLPPPPPASQPPS